MSISVNGVQDDNSKLSYITTAAFNGSIYQYTTQLNGTTFTTEGQLTAITTLPSGAAVTSTNCPAGRILRVTGRKLYPSANPGLAVGDKYNGSVVGTTATNHMWVAVFDSVTGLRAFIDPNSSGFAVYSTDRNRAFIDAAETAGGTPTRLGPSIYTAGGVTAGKQITQSSGTVTIPYTATNTTYSFSSSQSSFYVFTAAAAVGFQATSVPPSGTFVYVFFKGGFNITLNATGIDYASGGQVLAPGANTILITFVSNGTSLIEVSRTAMAVSSSPPA